MRLRASLICIGAGISLGIIAYQFGAPWWAHLPGIALSFVGLISLATLNSGTDRSGLGHWGGSS